MHTQTHSTYLHPSIHPYKFYRLKSYLYTYMHTHSYIYIYIHTHTQTHAYIRSLKAHTCIHTRIYIHTQTHAYIRCLKAQQGNMEHAQLKIADYYYHGVGTRKDVKKAVTHYRQALYICLFVCMNIYVCMYLCIQSHTTGKLYIYVCLCV